MRAIASQVILLMALIGPLGCDKEKPPVTNAAVAAASPQAPPKVPPLPPLDTNSQEYATVMKYYPNGGEGETWLVWFSPEWNKLNTEAEQAVASIQDVTMRNELLAKKKSDIRSKANIEKFESEANSNWSRYSAEILDKHSKDLREIPEFSYSTEKEIINDLFPISIKDIDAVYNKVKNKHIDEIKLNLNALARNEESTMLIYNQVWTPNGLNNFLSKKWPKAEETVRQIVMVLAYNPENGKVLLIDRDDNEIYYEWSGIKDAEKGTKFWRKMEAIKSNGKMTNYNGISFEPPKRLDRNKFSVGFIPGYIDPDKSLVGTN